MHCSDVSLALPSCDAQELGCGAGRQTTPSAASEQGKAPRLLLPANRATGYELMHDASDEMQQRIKVPSEPTCIQAASKSASHLHIAVSTHLSLSRLALRLCASQGLTGTHGRRQQDQQCCV